MTVPWIKSGPSQWEKAVTNYEYKETEKKEWHSVAD
jgi:hypothetical protein